MDAKTTEAVELLRRLIATPSTSRDESRTADLLFAFLEERGAAPERLHNNVFARSADFDPARPTLLLNSHHDTVRPAASYTRDPFAPTAEGDRLYGLGSNDAGASVVSLARTFLTFREQSLPFNLLLALSAEEECMGEHGMRALLPQLGTIDMALVGEPTGMQAARRRSYVSPTTSDMALMPFPSLKMGPGESSRSHTADEYVLMSEIGEGIGIYEEFIRQLAGIL